MGAPILEHPAHASRSGQDSYVSKGGLLSGQSAGMITKQNLTKYGALSLTSSKFLLLKNKDISRTRICITIIRACGCSVGDRRLVTVISTGDQ